MKRRLQSISLFVLVAYLFVMVAGCGGNTDTTSSPQKPQVQQSTVVPTTTNQSTVSTSDKPVTPAPVTAPAIQTVQPATQTKTVDPAPAPQTNTQEQTVYITRTGAKYHRAGCRYLRQSCIPINLSDAKQSYDPCSVCDPPR